MFLKLLGKHFACRGRAFATRSFLSHHLKIISLKR